MFPLSRREHQCSNKKAFIRKEAFLFRPFDSHHPALRKTIMGVMVEWDSCNTRYRFELINIYVWTLLVVVLVFELIPLESVLSITLAPAFRKVF